jgi:5-methyltetrahydrofolate--homocysteine methyltransferase
VITLEGIDRAETIRYLGNSRVNMNEDMSALLDSCEKELLRHIEVKYLYKTVPAENSPLISGSDIRAHLKDCGEAVIMCATLGREVDRIIKIAQITDMSRAVVLDAMASSAIESVCARLEKQIARENAGRYLTWRFSPGYGDYPIELQSLYLSLLDAPRKIGLCANQSSMLIPTKSVTAIIGLSEKPVENRRRGCATCSLAGECKFRKAGKRCEF